MEITVKFKKWLKIQKIKLTNFLYKLIGTRCDPYTIAEDLPDIKEAWREFSILVDIWDLTKFKNDTLSPARLEGCIRAILKIRGANWKCPTKYFQSTIEVLYQEKLDFYEDSVYTESGDEIPCVAEGAEGELMNTFLLLEFMFKKEIEREI